MTSLLILLATLLIAGIAVALIESDWWHRRECERCARAYRSRTDPDRVVKAR